MAVLNKIRQRSLVLILVIALALFSFVIGDLFKNSDAFSGSSLDVVATVNGKDINRLDFQQKVKSYQERVGGRVTSTQAMNTIYNQELRNIILETEYDALGLSIEKDEMRDLLKTSFSSYQEFQDDKGNFDVNRLNAFISNLKDLNGQTAPLGTFMVSYQSWTNNEKTIATGALQNSYYNLIKAGVGSTVTEAKLDHIADAKNVDIKFVQIPYTTITDSLVQVTSSDVKDFMSKNEADYKSEANAEVIYVEFKEEASEEDENTLKSELLALKKDKVEYNESTKNNDSILGFDNTKDYETFVNSNSDKKFEDKYARPAELPTEIKDGLLTANVNDYFGPYKDGDFISLSKVIDTKELADSVKVRHILVPFIGATRADASITNTPEQAKAKADSIYNKIKSGTKFLDLLELSSDKVSNEKDGEIEFAYNAGMAPEFKAFSFENNVGDIEVVETSFGYHVIEILEQKSVGKTIKLATVSRKLEPSDKTLQDIFNKMSKFEIALKDGEFKTLAEEKGLSVKPINFKELDENVPGLGSQRQVVRWAFDEKTDINDYKNFPISGFGFIVAKVVERNEEGLMSVKDASITAAPKIRNEKKAKLILDKIKATSVNDIATNQNQTTKTAAALTMKATTLAGAGVEPKVVGAAFGLKQGETSKPIIGEKGIYIIEVTKVTELKDLENYSAISNRLKTAKRNTVQTKVYDALKESAEIDDNRAKTVY